MASAPLPLTAAARRRPDVEVFVQFARRRRVWNLKDPLALRYYQLNDEEFWLYEQLDGRRSIRELCAEFGRRFAPRRLAEQTLAGFLQQLHQVGLIVVDGPLQAEALVRRDRKVRDAERKQLWTRLFTWKLRGIDPEAWLDAVYPRLRPWFSPAALWCMGIFVALAGMTALVHGDELFRQAARIDVMLRPENALLLIAVIGTVKIVHEIGHALACKHFGGECHEMGVTIYLFMPAMYCNVSDAWTFPSKWSRAAVGAAGIVVELLLAAAAVFMWRWSVPGTFQTACLYVVLVGTVNTLLLNGNPLLRYDGYHVLSDLVEIPNLAGEADGVWRRWARRAWFGEASVPARDASAYSPATTVLLSVYAVASKIYMAVVVVGALWLLHQGAKQYGLQALTVPTTLAVVLAMAVLPASRGLKRVTSAENAHYVRRRRFWTTSLIVATLAAAVLLVPLPRRVRIQAVLRPADADAVYVTQSGFLRSATNKTQFAAGDELAKLDNAELQAEIVRCRSRLETAELQLKLLQRRQAGFGAAGIVDLPTAQKAVDDARSQLEARRSDEARLTLVAPRGGAFIPPAARPKSSDPRALPTWQRRPLDRENLGAYLEAGTIVGYVGDVGRLEAVAEADESEVRAIEIGATVELLADVAGGRTVRGRVAEIGVEDTGADETPRSSPPRGADVAKSPAKFRVRIALDETLDGVTLESPVVGVVAAPAECLASKLRRYWSQVFRTQ